MANNKKEYSIYDDWNPPAASTLYLRITKIPYKTHRLNMAKGANPLKLKQIENDLLEGNYNCKKCNYLERVDGQVICIKKKRKVTNDSICKTFKPRSRFKRNKITRIRIRKPRCFGRYKENCGHESCMSKKDCIIKSKIKSAQ